MLIRYRWPESNKYLAKIIVPFTVGTILFMLTAGVYVNQGGNSIDFKTSPKSSRKSQKNITNFMSNKRAMAL